MHATLHGKYKHMCKAPKKIYIVFIILTFFERKMQTKEQKQNKNHVNVT